MLFAIHGHWQSGCSFVFIFSAALPGQLKIKPTAASVNKPALSPVQPSICAFVSSG
jgi:hypothetical protein